MKSSVAAYPEFVCSIALPGPAALRWGALAACALVLAGCATQSPLSPGRGGGGGRYFDPILGVWASPRLVDDGQPVPRGGGGYLVGRPYTIGGRTFVPNANPQGYAAVGTASWYGDAFHGRRTANGEIFDKGSISAAHPTLPLPSYVRVTNLTNGRSMIVRVNDRGPYHGGRVMDVSQRVADALAFRNAGTGHVKIEYVGRASLAGSDDAKLLASLTTDGRPARLDGMAEPVQVADDALPPPPDAPSPLPNIPAPIARLSVFQKSRPIARLAPISTPLDTPVEPQQRPVAALAPGRPLLSRSFPVASARHPAPAGRDPFFKPLFPAPRPQAKPGISFAAPARKGAPPKRRDATGHLGKTPGDETQ
ncbi:MAG: septal ring lytic transglycosylase RlpA family protein [Janthinobacterium lividum]